MTKKQKLKEELFKLPISITNEECDLIADFIISRDKVFRRWLPNI